MDSRWATQLGSSHTSCERLLTLDTARICHVGYEKYVSYHPKRLAMPRSNLLPSPPSQSQIILLLTRPSILIQTPLHIAILILQRPTPNLKTPHRHPRPHLRQLDTLISCLHKHMMADLDAILDVLERHHSAAQLRLVGDGFSGWEDMF